MIASQDIKLFKSEVMDDTPEGGGRMTGIEVVDGQLNNVFDDRHDLEEIHGSVTLRKIFGGVTTANRDLSLGAHAAVTRPSSDPRVSTMLIALRNHSDRRAAARDYLEKYLLPGGIAPIILFGPQPKDAMQLSALQRPSDQPPSIGDVLCLSIEKDGHPNNGFQQFVRITQIDDEINRPEGQGAVALRIMYIGISEPLAVTFPGANILDYSPELDSRPTRVRYTTVSPSAQYYGCEPITQPIVHGSLTLYLRDILQPIVPSAYSESPLIDQQLGAETLTIAQSGPSMVTENLGAYAAVGVRSFTLMSSAVPRSVQVQLGDTTWTDDGDGGFTRTVGTSAAVPTIAHAARTLTLSGLAGVPASITVSYLPAAAVPAVQHTDGILIDENNRGFTFTRILPIAPAPGTAIATYRALGRWYTLRDDGSGVLVGPAGAGTGTVNTLAKSITLTCAVQPDIGSHVLFGCGSAVHFKQQTAVAVEIGVIDLQGEEDHWKPGTVSVSYSDGVDTYTSDDSATPGLLAGTLGSGLVDYKAGRVRLRPTQLRASAAEYTLAYDVADYVTETPAVQPLPVDGYVEVSTSESVAPLASGAGSITVLFNSSRGGSKEVTLQVVGTTLVRRAEYQTLWGGYFDIYAGTFNPATGTFRFLASIDVRAYSYGSFLGWLEYTAETLTYASIVSMSTVDSGAAGTGQSESHTPTELQVDLQRALIDRIVAGSVLFNLAGRDYFDAAGTLFYLDGNRTPVPAGVLDYVTGLGTITDWPQAMRSVSVKALLTRYGAWTMSRALWRVNGSPLRPESFQVTDGTNAWIADDNGDLQGPAGLTGTINTETGVYDVTFDPPVAPELARYNAVVLTYLPLNPDIIGLNPVRLPLNGKVPIFRPGYGAIIVNEQTYTLPNPAVAGQTYNVGRTLLSRMVVRDAEGTRVPSDRYTFDLDAGTITMATPLNLGSYVQPLQVAHRIEDKVEVVDAQLGGVLKITGFIGHDYPVEGTYVCSILEYGTLQARTSIPFDQVNWTGVWSDVPVTAGANAEADAINYPIQVANKGAVTERWRFEFINTTTFRLYGESRGLIGQWAIDTDYAPNNPAAGAPYMTVRKEFWSGGGWAFGNIVRVNTYANAAPMWLAQCRLKGPVTVSPDSAVVEFRLNPQEAGA